MGKAERVARLMECWRVLLLEFDQAQRWRDRSRLGGLATALKIIDACVAIEDETFAERDKFGNITSDPDQLVLTRLREIAIVRAIFKDVDASDEPAAPVPDDVEPSA